MENNKKEKSDEMISRIFNDDPLLRSFLKLTKQQTDALTEEQKRENFVEAIMDASKTDQKT